MLKGKQQFKFKVVLNSDERSGDEAKQKGFKVRIFVEKRKFDNFKIKNNIIN